jgi:hypothetical protein
MRSELLGGSCRAARALILVVSTLFCTVHANAFNLFATHEVTAQFATPEGKPMANAEVRVFEPDNPSKVALTGRTDADGKFVFAADQDGFWSVEARSADYVTRVMIRVGGETQSQTRMSPFLFIGVLVALLGLAIWYRLLRARVRRPPP